MKPDLRAPVLAVALLAVGLLAGGAVQAAPVLPAEGKVEVGFAPWDDVERLVMDQIDGAKQAVYVQAYMLTSRPIAKTLIAAHERGIKVEVIADREKVLKDEYSALPRVAGHGVPLWLDGAYSAAHSKVIIIDPDGKTPVVVTGSYNFSVAGKSKNAENVLVLSGQRALAAAYMQNWQRHRTQSVSFAEAVQETLRGEAVTPLIQMNNLSFDALMALLALDSTRLELG